MNEWQTDDASRRAGHDWRLVPLAAVAWAGSWIGVSGWYPAPTALGALVVGLGLLSLAAARLGRAWASLAIVVLAVTGLVAGAQSWQRHHSVVAQLAAERATATARVRIDGDSRTAGETVVAQATLVWVEARGRRIEASVPVVVLGVGDAGARLAEAQTGAQYVVTARLGAPEPDESASAILSLRRVEERVADPGILASGANAMREGLRDAVGHSPPKQAAIVPSLVVGDTSRVDDDLRRQFQLTGLTHLMAVSGANLTLMLGVVLAVVRRVGLRGWAVRGAAVAGVAGFVLVCGPDPSVLRAAAMGLVALAGIGVGAGRRSLRALSVAILALVWLDPWLARSAGFALSVMACAGIVVFGPRLVEALSRWAPRWLAEALAVPLAAQVVTQPVVTAISGQVSVVGVLTNTLAGPFVGPTTVLGLAAALLCWVPWLAAGPGWVAGWCAQPILWLAGLGSALPAAAVDWPTSPEGLTAVSVAAVALLVVLPPLLGRRLGAAGLLLALVLACLIRPIPLGWPGEWSAVFCDVGQGDATVLVAGPGAAMLIDAAPEARPVGKCLDSLGIDKLEIVVLTHWHADHVGGASEIIRRYRPGLIVTRAGPRPAWIENAAREAGAELRAAVPGERLGVGRATWTTVSAWEPAGAGLPESEGEGTAENDASLVGIAEADGLRVLISGDAEPDGQSAALRSAAALGMSLGVHVLKLPHHGSARQEPRLFAATGATLAVVSAGEGNPYGHPAMSALSLAAERGMTVVRTDTMGSVAVGLDDGELRLRTWRPGGG